MSDEILDLKDQTPEAQAIEPYTTKLMDLLDQRKVMWDKQPDSEEKKKWLISRRDPILDIAETIGTYIYNEFPEIIDGLRK